MPVRGPTGRWTVPVLWDTETDTIVTNESAEIMRMLLDKAEPPRWTQESEGYRTSVLEAVEVQPDPYEPNNPKGGSSQELVSAVFFELLRDDERSTPEIAEPPTA